MIFVHIIHLIVRRYTPRSQLTPSPLTTGPVYDMVNTTDNAAVSTSVTDVTKNPAYGVPQNQ